MVCKITPWHLPLLDRNLWAIAASDDLRGFRRVAKLHAAIRVREACGLFAGRIHVPSHRRITDGVPLVMVTPDTVLRWQRRRFREHWTRLSGRPTVGRPCVTAEIRALVTRMAPANPLWGAPRIHGELLKLGIDVAERTVSRLLPKRRSPPSQTWRTFLINHVRDLVSIDFFTVPTARLHVLFVLVVLAHHRRRVLHFNVTEHPTAAWTAQQIVDAFPDDSAPSYLLRDRDSVYGHVFRQRVKGMGVDEVLTAPHSPWQNPFAERLIGSIRRECLNHVLVPSVPWPVARASAVVN